ncbi:MAG TPA: tRNA (adenosine(37)-N6)-threonylcarbamoyltransferase complex transferase subunit TsaD [Clostridia bacterium]|nr:tRNA (adenosine(37)-N6)-threonylcarbamoyltransferase complex transferase subunit TsaD [Clostridia bacterium]
MLILGIETSCDETAAALVEDGRKVLSSVIHSQIEIHQPFGGVVPEIASRSHVERIDGVVSRALEESGKRLDEIDGVAVTQGPGLIGPLLVGLNYAKGLSYALNKPLYAIHHLDGHVAANYLAFHDLEPPFLSLILSGGHSHFYLTQDYGVYKYLGGTRDDALGEAFDKVARILGLSYPGGPKVEEIARQGQPSFSLPKTMLEKGSLDFSFSGIKSAVKNLADKLELTEKQKADLAASFQETVFSIVYDKLIEAIEQTGQRKIIIAGGVASNQRLREVLADLPAQVFIPPLSICTDNGAMIAGAAYYKALKEDFAPLSLNAKANLSL